jgi:hypothetical protein
MENTSAPPWCPPIWPGRHRQLDALHEARPKDNRGNSVIGKAELVDCREVLVESDGPRVGDRAGRRDRGGGRQ